MLMQRTLIRPIYALILASLAGCVLMPSTKDIAGNPRAHAEGDLFSPDKLQGTVNRKITEGNAVTPNFRQLTVTYAMDHQQPGLNDKVTVVTRLTNSGNGLVRLSREYFHGSISYAAEFVLSYIGIVPLRSQSAQYNNVNPSLIEEITEFTLFNKQMAAPVENAEYVFEGRTGLWLTPSNRLSLTFKCRSGTSYPAGSLHPSVKGDAIDLICEEQLSQGYAVRRYAFLRQYGVAVILEAQASTFKQVWTISKFEAL